MTIEEKDEAYTVVMHGEYTLIDIKHHNSNPLLRSVSLALRDITNRGWVHYIVGHHQ